MALNFLNGAARKREQVVSIDLGGRTTKAVQINNGSGGYELSRYAVLDAPLYESGLSADLLSEHVKSVCQALDTKTRSVTLALGVGDSVVRHADLPVMPLPDMRQVLKINSRNYLQQDLSGYVFDCCILAARPVKGEKSATAPAVPKVRVLAAGARRELVRDIQSAIKSTGFIADAVVPGLIGPVNAFEAAMPEVFAKEAVALVDIGFKSTSISLLQEGELVLSRVVSIGGDGFTSGLAEALGISYAEAESIKLGIPSEVESQLQALIHPLGRELRASIDCFEHQQDRAVTQIYVSGGTTQSQYIMQCLQTDLMLECKPWNPLNSMKLALPPEQTAEIDQVGPQLTVAIGAALVVF